MSHIIDALTELGEFKGKRPRRKQGESELEKKVAKDLRALGLMEGCQTQYRFHPTRRWLADFAWPTGYVHKAHWEDAQARAGLMLEVNGGTYLQGRRRGAHSRPVRQRQDYEKWTTASLMGWTLLLVDSVDVKKGRHVELVLQALGKA